MSKIVKVNHDEYKIIVNNGGNIVLDTGSLNGSVIVSGNLDVKGTVTIISSTDMQIKDNIIQLNVPGPNDPILDGISQVKNYQSGIQIERGSRDAAQFVFNEQVSSYDSLSGTDVNGTWILKDTTNKLQGVSLRTITNDGLSDITFDLQNSTNILSIANSTDYYLRVTDDNDIPNKQYVNVYVGSGEYTAGMADVDKIYTRDSTHEVKVQTTLSSINNYISGTNKLSIDSAVVKIDNLNLSNNTITTIADSLKLTSFDETISVNSILSIENTAIAVTPIENKTQVYSANSTLGKSGLYVANSLVTDELVVANRALLLSMIF
jgi:hypothetical protein